MRANKTEYLFSVNTQTPPTMTVDSGEEFTVEVRGAFDDVEDISAVPTPFTPQSLRFRLTLPLPLEPTSLGTQILVQLSDGITRLADEFAATAPVVTEFPILWRWLVHELTNPAARAELLDASWKPALVVGCALGAEWLTLRGVRRPLTVLKSRASGGGGVSQNNDNGRLAAAERDAGSVRIGLAAGGGRIRTLGPTCGSGPLCEERDERNRCSRTL